MSKPVSKSRVKKRGKKLEYAGYVFEGFNRPQKSRSKNKKMVVLARKGDEVKLIHFGQRGYSDFTRHGDTKRRENYLKRSAGIRDKAGRKTASDRFSANYWARKILW